jgi:hypothetical protein
LRRSALRAPSRKASAHAFVAVCTFILSRGYRKELELEHQHRIGRDPGPGLRELVIDASAERLARRAC